VISLGNLTIEQMEKRTGVEWPSELRTLLADRHQDRATDIAPGKWHCFDLPFFLVCGDMETAQTVYDHLRPLSTSFKEPLQIGVQP